MYPPAGPTPLRSSITLVGWLLTILPSSLPFHVPSSSLNCDDLCMQSTFSFRRSSKKGWPACRWGAEAWTMFHTVAIDRSNQSESYVDTKLTCCRGGRTVRSTFPYRLNCFRPLSYRRWSGPYLPRCGPVALFNWMFVNNQVSSRQRGDAMTINRVERARKKDH